MLTTIGDKITRANGTNLFSKSKTPHIISKDFSKTRRYLNSNIAITLELVGINGSK